MYQEQLLIDSEYAPGGIIVYYADGDEEIIHVNQYIINLFECDDLDDFMAYVGGSFKNLVYQDDLTAAENSIWQQIDTQQGFDHIYYRIRTKNGRMATVDDYGHLIQDHIDGRPIFYVFIAEVTLAGSVDWLTGLPSMTRFLERTRTAAHETRNAGIRPVALAFNIMGMRSYNTRFGNAEGDHLLRSFAEILRKHFGTEYCSRFADDRFFAFAPESDLSQRVTHVFDEFGALDLPAALPVRAGAYVCESSDDISTVGINRAKIACDVNDVTWHSHLTWFTDEMRHDARLRLYVANHLGQAIEKGWIRPLYQPIVRAATGKVCGEEVLLRWYDPNYGELLPGQVVKTLEDADLLHVLDLHMLDCVLRDLHLRKEANVTLVPVSLNFSPFDFAHINVVDELVRRCDAAGIDRRLIRIEMRESMALADTERMQTWLTSLQSAGFEVWIDNFGQGYSSLGAMQQLRFDVIKMDMGFLHEALSSKGRNIVEGIVQTARNLNVRTLAEGVETKGQAEFLEHIGCNYLQGHYFAHPLRLDVIIAHAQAQDGLLRESPAEQAYWDAVSMVNLYDLAQIDTLGDSSISGLYEFPAGVIEHRAGTWHVVRANPDYSSFLHDSGLLLSGTDDILDGAYYDVIETNGSADEWTRISGKLELGSEYQFYARRIATLPDATAYLIGGLPTLLGNALGSYGDVPVAYAVLHVVFDEAKTKVVDVEYVYVNDTYCSWMDCTRDELVGFSSLEVYDDSNVLFPYCYRAVVLGERVRDVVYNSKINHWVAFNIVSSPVENHCIYAFSYADKEQQEREEMLVGLDTSDIIIHIADILSNESKFDSAVSELLETISQLVTCDRLFLMEQPISSCDLRMGFEWDAPGIAPREGALCYMSEQEVEILCRHFKDKDIVLMPNVLEPEDLPITRKRAFVEQNVHSEFIVPLYNDGQLLGYLGGDNYAFKDHIDTIRLLRMVGMFLAAHIANHRYLSELRSLSLLDSLTGLLNRRGIDTTVAERVASGDGSRYVLALMDVDDFKTVNDLYGHDVGDEVLRTIARRLEQAFPKSAIIGRNGGDEFLVMLLGDDASDADTLFANFLSEKCTCTVMDKTYNYSMSVGYVEYPLQVTSLQAAYNKADAALYAVKLSGKSSYGRYEPNMETQYRSQLGFTPRDITENVPGAIVVHKSATSEVLFANNELIELTGCSSLDDFMAYTGGLFLGLVHPDDREPIDKLTSNLEIGDTYHAEYRVLTKSGEVCNVVGNGRLSELDGIGKVFYDLIVG